MTTVSSPPKKRPKLSLKFMRKDKLSSQQSQENGSNDGSICGHFGESNSSTADSTTTTTTTTTRDNQRPNRPNPPPFAGMKNLGNTCYLNSVLQALRFCPGFDQGLCHLVGEWDRLQVGAKMMGNWGAEVKMSGREMEFAVNLKRLYDKMSAKEAEYLVNPSPETHLSLSPQEVLETVRDLNPMFRGFLQHDSQELLCCLLSNLMEACQKLKKQFRDKDQLRSVLAAHPTTKVRIDNGESPSKRTVLGSDTKNGTLAEQTENGTPTSWGNPSINGLSETRTTDHDAGNVNNTSIALNNCETNSKGDHSQTVNGDSSIRQSLDEKLNGFDNHSTNVPESKTQIPKNGSGNREILSVKKKRLRQILFTQRQADAFPVEPDRSEVQGDEMDTSANAANPSPRGGGGDGDESTTKQMLGPNIISGNQGRQSNKTETVLKSSGGLEFADTCAHASDGQRTAAAATEPRDSASTGRTDVGAFDEELSSIQSLFQGSLVLRTRCNECESYTERREKFQDISLPVRCPPRSAGDDENDRVADVSPIDLSLSWAISEFACVERLTDDNKYFCEHCRHHSEAERSMLFGELPPVLTIHLKRFSAFSGYLSADSTVSKVNDHLATPLSLSLGQWCTGQCKQLRAKYALCALVMHSGVSSSSGHYVSYAQIPEQRLAGRTSGHGDATAAAGQPLWAKFDDENVTLLTQQGLAMSVLHPVASCGSAATPYLLFYRQVTETE